MENWKRALSEKLHKQSGSKRSKLLFTRYLEKYYRNFVRCANKLEKSRERSKWKQFTTSTTIALTNDSMKSKKVKTKIKMENCLNKMRVYLRIAEMVDKSMGELDWLQNSKKDREQHQSVWSDLYRMFYTLFKTRIFDIYIFFSFWVFILRVILLFYDENIILWRELI